MIRLLMLGMTMMLTGCLSTSGIFSTGAATTAAVAGTHLVSPAAGVALGAAAGLATDAAIPDPVATPEDFAGPDGELNFYEMLAFMWANFTQHIITIGILGGVLWIVTGYLGMRMPRREEKAAEKQVKMLVDKIGSMKEK